MNLQSLGTTDLRVIVPTALMFLAVLVSVPGFMLLAKARANNASASVSRTWFPIPGRKS
jgi:hypothetical protein